jgi:PKD repeat protein
MKKTLIVACGLIILVASAIWTPKTDAYPTYSEIAAGNCLNCHGDFRGFGYVSFKDGTPWGTDLMNGHLINMLRGSTCFACHTSPFFPVSLSSSGDETLAISCVGCHGRSEDAGNDSISPGLGAGLRQHHYNVGVTMCGGCHVDANPANYTPVGEDVLPPNYGHPDVTPTDPCDADGSESVFGSTGLDNDGDLLSDGNDPDCATNNPPVANPNGPYTGTVGQPVQFDGSGSFDPDGTIVSYDWDFGDSNTGTGVIPTHTYAAPGTYTVSLTVTDDGGATDTSTTTATIDDEVLLCEGDFDCDGDVDAGDVATLLVDFGRSIFFNPCESGNPCNGDFLCDGDVDADDVSKFLKDFGRSQFFNPCPACEEGDWCPYCEGKECLTYTFDCNPNVPCACFRTAEGSGVCIDSVLCTNPTCTTSADCGPHEVCIVDTCCPLPICAPNVCTDGFG